MGAVTLKENLAAFEDLNTSRSEALAEQYDINYLKDKEATAYTEINKAWDDDNEKERGLNGFSEGFEADNIETNWAGLDRRSNQAERLVKGIRDRVKQTIGRSLNQAKTQTESYGHGNSLVDNIILRCSKAKRQTTERIFSIGRQAETSMLMAQMHLKHLEKSRAEVLKEWDDHYKVQMEQWQEMEKAKMFEWDFSKNGGFWKSLGKGLKKRTDDTDKGDKIKWAATSAGLTVGAAILGGGLLTVGASAGMAGLAAKTYLSKNRKPFERFQDFSDKFQNKLAETFDELESKAKKTEVEAAENADRAATRIRRRLESATDQELPDLMQAITNLAKGKIWSKKDAMNFQLQDLSIVQALEAFRAIGNKVSEDRQFLADLLGNLQKADSFSEAYERTQASLESAKYHEEEMKDGLKGSFPESYESVSQKNSHFEGSVPSKSEVDDDRLIKVLEAEFKINNVDINDLFDENLRKGDLLTKSLKLKVYLESLFNSKKDKVEDFSEDSKSKILRWFMDFDSQTDVVEADYTEGENLLNTLRSSDGLLGTIRKCAVSLKHGYGEGYYDKLNGLVEDFAIKLSDSKVSWETHKDDIPERLRNELEPIFEKWDDEMLKPMREHLQQIKNEEKEIKKKEEALSRAKDKLKTEEDRVKSYNQALANKKNNQKDPETIDSSIQEAVDTAFDNLQGARDKIKDFQGHKALDILKKLDAFNVKAQIQLHKKADRKERESNPNHKLVGRLNRHLREQHKKDFTKNILGQMEKRRPFDHLKDLKRGTPVKLDYTLFDGIDNIHVPDSFQPDKGCQETFYIARGSESANGIILTTKPRQGVDPTIIQIIGEAVDSEGVENGIVNKNAMISAGTKTPGTMGVVWNMKLAT